MGGKRMPQGMDAGVLGNTCLLKGFPKGPLQCCWRDMPWRSQMNWNIQISPKIEIENGFPQ